MPPLLALQGRRVLTASRQPQIWAQASPIKFSADLDFPPQGPQRTVGQSEQTCVTKPQGAFPLCWSELTNSEVLPWGFCARNKAEGVTGADVTLTVPFALSCPSGPCPFPLPTHPLLSRLVSSAHLNMCRVSSCPHLLAWTGSAPEDLVPQPTCCSGSEEI